MKNRSQIDQWRRVVGMNTLWLLLTVLFQSSAFAQGTIMVGISPLTSKVADIPAEAAQELFINALMETNHFAIRPPDARGSHAGSTYVFEPTISEVKGKTNVLGFLKDVASKGAINLSVKVFDPRSNALLKSVTVKSTDVKAEQVTMGDVKSLMGVFGAGKDEPAGKREQSDDSGQLEERLGGLMQEAANRLATQLGGGNAGNATVWIGAHAFNAVDLGFHCSAGTSGRCMMSPASWAWSQENAGHELYRASSGVARVLVVRYPREQRMGRVLRRLGGETENSQRGPGKQERHPHGHWIWSRVWGSEEAIPYRVHLMS